MPNDSFPLEGDVQVPLGVRKFEFGLDPLIRLKAQYLEMEEARLRASLQKEITLLQARQQAVDALREEEKFLSSCNSLSGDILLGYSEYQKETAKRIAEAAAEIDDCRRSQQAVRERIVGLERERELLQKLRSRRHRQWKVEMDKETDSLAHEAYLGRIARESDSG